jgi:hypothetical protein
VAGDEPVAVAFARDPIEGEMIQGLLSNEDIPSLLQPTGLVGTQFGRDDPQPGYGGGGSVRVMVRPDQVERARALLAEVMVEDEEEAWPETANARHLEKARGRGPRGYGYAGAMTRIFLWSITLFAVAFGLIAIFRAL